MIPIEYLSKMGGHCVEIQGVELKVKVVNLEKASNDYDDRLLDTYIKNMKSGFKAGPRVIGVDIIRRLTYNYRRSGPYESLVLCGGAANCLIFHLPYAPYLSYYKVPQVLLEFLEDSNVCFVGETRWPSSLACGDTSLYQRSVTRGVEAGDLASRVLNKPALDGMSLSNISQEVGVNYRPSAYVTPTGAEMEVDENNPTGLTEEQIKAAVNDAYAYYRIGHRLLNSL